jgi:hypothetical protein
VLEVLADMGTQPVIQVRALSIQGLARGSYVEREKEKAFRLNEDALDDFAHLALSDVVVVDESHNLRSPTARSTKVFRLLTSLPLPGEDWPIYVDNQRVVKQGRARIGVVPPNEKADVVGVLPPTWTPADRASNQSTASNAESVAMAGPGRRILLMSATPFNNRLEDFTTQLGHYLRVQIWPRIKSEEAAQVLYQM